MKKFVADSMNGKLAKKLRFFGFNTLYYKQISDNEIIKIAIEENRIILTSDYELYKLSISKNIEIILTNQESDLDNLTEIGKLLNWQSLDDSKFSTRCTVCNNELVEIKKEELQKIIPRNTFQRFYEYYRCCDCSKIYWKGSHWNNMMNIAQAVNKKLEKK